MYLRYFRAKNTEFLNTQTATTGDCLQQEKEKTKTKSLRTGLMTVEKRYKEAPNIF